LSDGNSDLTPINITTISSTNNNNTNDILSSSFLTYYSPGFEIMIQYPNDWRISTFGLEDYSQIVSFLSPLENLTDTFPAKVVISQYNYVQNVTLDSFTNMTLNQSRILDINITEPKRSLLSGLDAYELVTTLDIENELIPIPVSKVMEVWTAYGNKVYKLTYVADEPKYSKYLPKVQKMKESFKIADT
jgi:hypothetical protein